MLTFLRRISAFLCLCLRNLCQSTGPETISSVFEETRSFRWIWRRRSDLVDSGLNEVAESIVMLRPRSQSRPIGGTSHFPGTQPEVLSFGQVTKRCDQFWKARSGSGHAVCALQKVHEIAECIWFRQFGEHCIAGRVDSHTVCINDTMA